jgi:hypothetical protein
MTITKDQADAARKLVKAYAEQEWEAAEARRSAARAATQALIDASGVDLTAWAKHERERDLRNGNGRGVAKPGILDIAPYVGAAHARLALTLEAFGVDAVDFFKLVRKEVADDRVD